MRPIDVDPAIKQALWRLALNGNPHWVRYFTTKGKPQGTNDGTCSTGYVDSHGKDRTKFAGKPYFYTAEQVDRDQRGFGFWSRSEAGTLRFLAHDIEVTETTAHGQRGKVVPGDKSRFTLTHAITVYETWVRLAKAGNKIAAVGLFQSSKPGNYHVWVWLAEGLTQAQHDELLARHTRYAQASKRAKQGLWLPQYEDKNTSKAKKGLGTMFRAPWSWKRGIRSEALRLFVPDRELLIRLGEETKPAIADRPRTQATTPTPFQKDDVQYLTDWSIHRWPIPARGGKGARNRIQASLILALMQRGVEPDTLERAGIAWLDHFQTNFEMPLRQAESEFRACLERTLHRESQGVIEITGCDPEAYKKKARLITFSPLQKRFLSSPKTCEGVLSLHVSGRDNTPRSFSATDKQVLEALFVQCQIDPGDLARGEVKFTLEQLRMDVLKARHPRKPPTFTNQALGSEYLPRFVTRPDAKVKAKRQASVLELLVRTDTGVTGKPSTFRLTPAMCVLLGLDPEHAEKTASSPRPETENGGGGKKAARGPKREEEAPKAQEDDELLGLLPELESDEVVEEESVAEQTPVASIRSAPPPEGDDLAAWS
jgi:hypothetical protein